MTNETQNNQTSQTLTGYIAPTVPFTGPAFAVFCEAAKMMQTEAHQECPRHWRDHVVVALCVVVERINSELSEPLTEWAIDRIHEDAINITQGVIEYMRRFSAPQAE